MYVPFSLFAGLKVVYNVTNPPNKRVVSVDVLCQKCLTPRYEPLDKTKTYRIIAQNFLATGGDGFRAISDYKQNYKIGPVDIDSVKFYLENVKTVTTGNNGRITVLT